MSVFLLIIVGLPVLHIVWWVWADGRLRGLRRARIWRSLLGAFAGLNLLLYLWLFTSRMGMGGGPMPTALLGLCYIWYLLVLPATVVILAGTTLLRVLRGAVYLCIRVLAPAPRFEATEGIDADEPAAELVGQRGLTRRQLLTAGLVALPPAVAGVGHVRGMSQVNSFRIRRIDLEIPTLPPALDGVTIAHVSDLHVGRFTNGRVLDEVVEQTNALGADLVAFTGDLIDHALADLPAGVGVLKRLEPRDRVFVCEGNHDLFEGRREFEQGVRDAGVRMLINESADCTIRGQRVQILGLRWGEPGAGRGAQIDRQVERVLPLRDQVAFPILLAHHPHAFDAAARAGIPLTLAGHTHGGQLMLTEQTGAGPLMFKYWSGVYRHGMSRLAVSNGVGNWFPLRINAPAEILHLTLRRVT